MMLRRIQRSGEPIQEYIYDKKRLCKLLKLNFEETKERILVGLKSKPLSEPLMTIKHSDVDELMKDVMKFVRISEERKKLYTGVENFNRIPVEHEPVYLNENSIRRSMTNQLKSNIKDCKDINVSNLTH